MHNGRSTFPHIDQNQNRGDHLQILLRPENTAANVIALGQPGSPVLPVAVLGRQPLHQLMDEVAVVHGEAAVHGVQRVRHA